jgi:GAF domain-containing protein
MTTPARYELPTWAALPAVADPDLDALARTVAGQLAVPRVMVILVSKAGQVFPGAFGLPAPWDARRSMPLSHSLAQHVAGSGLPLVIRDAREDPMLRDNPSVQEFGVVGYAGVPLLDVHGRPMGVFCAVDTRPRDWTAREVAELERRSAQCAVRLQGQALQLAEREARAAAERDVAAARASAVAAQAAYVRAEAEADRARVVARLGEGLLTVHSLADVLRTVDRLVRSPLGATAVVLGVARGGSSTVATWTASALVVKPCPSAQLHLDDAHPLSAAVRDRRLVTVATRREGEEVYPTLRELPDARHESAIAVPLLLGQHESSGALMVSWRGRRELDQAVRAVAGDLARHVGHAMDRVLLADQRRRLDRTPAGPGG